MPILKWLDKEKTIKASDKVQYRLLKEIPEYSYGKNNNDTTNNDNNNENENDNIIIQGDNLEALKSLLPFYAGQVKCVYIDPPYNTGNAFEHYNDNLEHSMWLNMMYPRLELLKELMSEDGVIFVQIDDQEQAYLKVMMDEVFGRKNFITNITCKVKAPSGVASNAQPFFDCAEYILCYSKSKDFDFTPLKTDSYIVDENARTIINSYNQVLKKINYNTIEYIKNIEDIELYRVKDYEVETIPSKDRNRETYYNNFENIFRLAVMSGGKDKKVLEELNKLENPNDFYLYRYKPSKGKNANKLVDSLSFKRQGLLFLKDYSIKDDENKQIIKQDIMTNIIYQDLWQGSVGEGGVEFKNSKKPEKLLKILFDIMTKENDLILDSFLGSGTTCAVAHKMNRRYIGIEMGEHAKTHCVERLKKVIDGEQGGISKSVDWQGGGSFKFYELGEPLFDEFSEINKNVNFDNLASFIWFSETKMQNRSSKEKKNSDNSKESSGKESSSKEKNNKNNSNKTTFIGIHNKVSYSLLYNGILSNKEKHIVDMGNVLTSKTLNIIIEDIEREIGKEIEKEIEKDKQSNNQKNNQYETMVVYGESCRINPQRLRELNVVFKQIPYNIRKR